MNTPQTENNFLVTFAFSRSYAVLFLVKSMSETSFQLRSQKPDQSGGRGRGVMVSELRLVITQRDSCRIRHAWNTLPKLAHHTTDEGASVPKIVSRFISIHHFRVLKLPWIWLRSKDNSIIYFFSRNLSREWTLHIKIVHLVQQGTEFMDKFHRIVSGKKNSKVGSSSAMQMYIKTKIK